MRYWIQMMQHDLAGKLSDVCGTDGMHVVDGRLSQYNMHREAMKYAQRMSLVHKYDAYRIVKGESFAREARSVGPFKLTYPVHV